MKRLALAAALAAFFILLVWSVSVRQAVLFLVGIGLGAIGLVAIAIAVPISDSSFGNGLLISGVVGTCTGFLLVGLWLAGLAAHTIALTAALTGLTHRRAMLLSLTGSAVANVLPLGGAAGIAMNQRMTRSWGFPNSAFVTYSVVTNVWDVLAKAFVPVLVLPVLILGGPAAHHATRLIAAAAIVLPMIGLATTFGRHGP